jgi:hypothetical protein
MTPPTLALDPHLLLWPALLGLGVFLVVTRQPLGRPGPDLRAWLDRYDVDRRRRAERERARARLFESELL